VPTRVLLEGPAIEPLLAQVRDEYGSGVRIISADKVRSGGVGGFFAKQHYELSVEVPDPNEDRTDMAKRTIPDNGHTLERLLERAESQDRLAEPARSPQHSALGQARTVTPATFGTVRPGETTFSRPAAHARPAAPRPAEPQRVAEPPRVAEAGRRSPS
jgi:flagellar biosynthesis GTPase FlhF